MTRGLLAILLAGLAACSSPPPKGGDSAPGAAPGGIAARQQAALDANRRAENYVRHGELDNAARAYREALRLSQSLEDAEGIAANAISLSIVLQRQGRFADARASLAGISDPKMRFAPARQAEAALRHALIDLDERRFASAEQWLENAARHCAAGCPLAATVHNVRAQLALQADQVEAAAISARSALQLSRPGNPAETANALRLLGFAALRAGDGAAARLHLEQALALDRELGAPRKIALDLLALGRAAELAGERDAARAFFARALAVSEADRDSPGAAEARALLDGLDKAATGK
jgi:tetratricopeptide (TPR) repeat protein